MRLLVISPRPIQKRVLTLWFFLGLSEQEFIHGNLRPLSVILIPRSLFIYSNLIWLIRRYAHRAGQGWQDELVSYLMENPAAIVGEIGLDKVAKTAGKYCTLARCFINLLSCYLLRYRQMWIWSSKENILWAACYSRLVSLSHFSFLKDLIIQILPYMKGCFKDLFRFIVSEHMEM